MPLAECMRQHTERHLRLWLAYFRMEAEEQAAALGGRQGPARPAGRPAKNLTKAEQTAVAKARWRMVLGMTHGSRD